MQQKRDSGKRADKVEICTEYWTLYWGLPDLPASERFAIIIVGPQSSRTFGGKPSNRRWCRRPYLFRYRRPRTNHMTRAATGHLLPQAVIYGSHDYQAHGLSGRSVGAEAYYVITGRLWRSRRAPAVLTRRDQMRGITISAADNKGGYTPLIGNPQNHQTSFEYQAADTTSGAASS